MEKTVLVIGNSFAGQELRKGRREDCSYQLTIGFIFKNNLLVDTDNLLLQTNEVTL
ncbi:hypothetical protein AB4454_16185 [Vibrio artabrorum]|uniref:hypothetical protein n=1 Tax=Vibrio artabrorum TaxID=446374 RepID=UPI00354E6542